MNFTFLHCADLHLGSPMSGLSLKDPAIAARFAAATRDAFTDLVTRAIEERVAFVLIAGDLYDGEWQDSGVGLFFNREAARLARAGIDIYLVKGNHDAESVVAKTIAPPDNVKQFSTRAAEPKFIEHLRVAIHGRGFPDRAVTENIAAKYPAARAGWFNIGLLHTSCEGSAKHATYAPCSVAELAARGYDYWALGHVHDHQVLSRDPWIVYPGNLQGRSVRETGAKGAVFVDVADNKVAEVRRAIVDRARWIDVAIDVSSAAARADVLRLVAAGLREPLAEANGRLAAVRARLVGQTPLHRRLVSGHARLFDDALSLLQQAHADAWLEKLSVDTREPAARADIGSLDLEAMLDASATDAAVRRGAAELAGLIAARLPGEADGEDASLDDIDALIAEARAIALARALDADAEA
jgi:DNA repair exonuclease SbcCD nuclease subunit